MRVIKRYPNRKLYDTEEKEYITLEGIAQLIRQGEDVRVVDNSSGEDLTTVTMTQIILEQEKKKSSQIPNALLANLIRAGEDGISTLQRAFASSLNYWHQIDEEIKQRVQNLINQGTLSEREGRSLVDKLIDEGRYIRSGNRVDTEQIQKVLDERQIPTRSDIQQLIDQLNELTEKLESSRQTENKG